jgi:hypothetical protein
MKYEEDPLANALICVSECGQGCVDCRDFHLRSVLRRLHVPANKKTGDLAAFNEATRAAVQHLSDTLAILRIAIVGSTDTGILANLLTIAQEIGGDDLEGRMEITLMDQCATPLIICQAYAERCGVPLNTLKSDFLNCRPAGQFDFILMHGVVPFFPAHKRHDYLRHIASWLSAEGMLISSTHLGTKPYQNTDAVRTQMAIGNLKDLARQTSVLDDQMLASLIQRLEASCETHSTETTVFADVESANAAYEAAALNIISHRVVQLDATESTTHFRRYKQRSIVTCVRAN